MADLAQTWCHTGCSLIATRSAVTAPQNGWLFPDVFILLTSYRTVYLINDSDKAVKFLLHFPIIPIIATL